MQDPKTQFIINSQLYDKEKITYDQYRDVPDEQKHMYIATTENGDNAYYKIIPLDIADNDLYILSRFVTANNAIKIEKHLNTIKKILIAFAVLVGIGVATSVITALATYL